MTISANFYELSALLIAISFLVLVIALVPALLQLKRTIKAFEELSIESKKTVEGLNVIVTKAGEMTADVEQVLKKAQGIGLKVTDLADIIVDSLKSPLINIVSLLFGVEQGFKHFISRAKKEGGDDDGKQQK